MCTPLQKWGVHRLYTVYKERKGILQIKVISDQLIRGLKDEQKRIKQIMRSAIKRTIDQGWTEASRELTSEYYLQKKHIKAGIKKRVDNDGTGRLISSDKPMGFSTNPSLSKNPKWKVTATKSGSIKKFIRRGNKEVFNHAFIATMPTGHVGVFERNQEKDKRKVKVYKNGKFVYYKHLPIKELKGPSITSLFSLRNRVERLKKFMTDVYNKRFSHEFNRNK